MRETLENVNDELYKADSLMYAVENSCLDIDVERESREKLNRCIYLFYVLWDIIKKASGIIEQKLDGDVRKEP